MSQGIRDSVHEYIETTLTDSRLEEIRRILMSSAGKHSVSVPLKLKFEVNEDGLAKMLIDIAFNMKIPSWDVPVALPGQLTLWGEMPRGVRAVEERMQAMAPTATTPGAGGATPGTHEVQGTAVNTPAPPAPPSPDTEPLERTIPEEELSAPGLSVGLPAGLMEGSAAEQRMAALEASNKTVLSQGGKLTPEAQAALKSQAESA